jgi:condensin complex subunit 1
VIALGDVAVCFNNIVDENSNELWKGLSDRDVIGKIGGANTSYIDWRD